MSELSSRTLALLGAQDRGRNHTGDREGLAASPPAPGVDRSGDALGLLVVRAPNPSSVGAYHALDKAEVVIGRVGGTADVCVSDPGVSRCHAKVLRGPGHELIVEDLGSTNGTFVNGAEVGRAALSRGDRLQVGMSTEFLIGVRLDDTPAELRLQQAIATAGAGTWEWHVTAQAFRIYGGVARALACEEMPCQPLGEDHWTRVHPADREKLKAHFEAVLEKGGNADLEVRLLRRGGSALWVAMTGELFRDRGGRPLRIAGALMDVSERRRAQGELIRQSRVFEALADAVVVIGSGGTILDWNAAAGQLLGWSKVEVLGRRPGVLLECDGGRRLEEALAECERTGDRRSEEVTLASKSGQQIPVEMVTFSIPAEESELVSRVAVFRDLREQKRLQERLLFAERLTTLGTLAAGIAHEVNNPLSFVISNLEFLGDHWTGAGESSQLAEVLAETRRGAERIAGIVGSLQALGRKVDSIEPEPLDPNAALEFALKVVDHRIRSRACLLKELRPVPPVMAAPGRLGQVFLNLLVNAAQAFGDLPTDGATVQVSSRYDATTQRVIVEVTDNGVGIPHEALSRIFDAFFTTKPIGQGCGLGLFLCKGIVADLGGEITVESEVGKGSTFRVSLPASTQDSDVAPGGRAPDIREPLRC